MKYKLQLMFGFTFLAITCIFFNSGKAQGVGDRNRPAGRGSYRIVARVLLPNGLPAKGVNVSVNGMEMNTGSSGTTDDDGTFDFSGLSSGNYTVTARAAGFGGESETLTIPEGASSGQGFNIVIHLRMPGQKKGDVSSANPLFKDVPKSALEKFRKGAEKVQSNDPKAAIPLFESAVAEYPSFAAAYYDLGDAYVKTGDLDKALAAFVKAIQVKPDFTEAKYYVGYTHYLKNDLEVAAAIFDDVLKINETPEAHYYLGLSLAKLHQYAAAVPHLKAALAKKDDVTMALAHRVLGGIYLQKKQNAAAAEELQHYLDLVPKAPDADKVKATIAELKKGS